MSYFIVWSKIRMSRNLLFHYGLKVRRVFSILFIFILIVIWFAALLFVLDILLHFLILWIHLGNLSKVTSFGTRCFFSFSCALIFIPSVVEKVDRAWVERGNMRCRFWEAFYLMIFLWTKFIWLWITWISFILIT